jgi:hypothetical protein
VTPAAADVFAGFVHRRGGLHHARAVYECRQCGGQVRAAYRDGAPDTNRVREQLRRHLAARHGEGDDWPR